MALKDWLWLGTVLLGYLVAIIGVYVRLIVRINKLEMEMALLRNSFHLHEQQNEKANDKLENKLDDLDSRLNSKLDNIQDILMRKG